MNLTVTFKETTKPKLTIAKDRWELKLNQESWRDIHRYCALTDKVIYALWNDEMLTRRGSFEIKEDGKLTIIMTVGKGKYDPILFVED
jgi:hypothetical protein